MAGNAKITELEARKRALVTESELCREALKAELANLHAHASGFVHTFDRIRSVAPWLMLAGPVAVPILSFFFKRSPDKAAPHRSGFKGALATGLLALKTYRKYGPIVRSLVDQFRAKRRAARQSRTYSQNQ
jgi:hypothetical protein